MKLYNSYSELFKGIIKNPVRKNGIFGEDEWARTTDPLHVKQVL